MNPLLGALCLAAVGMDLTPTVFLREIDGKLLQVAHLHTDGPLPADVSVEGGGETYVQTVTTSDGDLLVPALPPDAAGTLTVRVGGTTQEFPWRGPRHWTLFLVPYSHVDVGFTNDQEIVRGIQMRNLTGQVDAAGNPVGALELMDQTDDWPEGSRFKFTSEVAWPVLELLRDPTVPEEKKTTLLRRLREGRMEVGAFLINATNKFMGEEALVRETTMAAERLAASGVPVVSAMLDDVGDAESAARVLAASGVRYFMFGPNSIHFGLPPLFYLDAGGGARVLVWLTPNNATYGEDTDLGLRPPPPPDPTLPHDPFAALPDYPPLVGAHLEWLETEGIPLPGPSRRFQYRGFQTPYPYDDYLVPYYPAHAGDNGHQDLTPARIARDWNAAYAWPRMRVATIREFFQDAESRWGARIPTFHGDFSGFWGEQIFFSVLQSDPGKEARQREMEALLGGAEGFGALGALAWPGVVSPPPRDGAALAFQEVTLNNDHNPIPVNISGNRCPKTSSGICFDASQVEAWRATHQTWSRESYAFAARESSRVLSTLGAGMGCPVARCVAVFNPVGWKRTEPVELPGVQDPITLVDPRDGAPNPVQILDGGGVFIARDLPPWGYVLYSVGPPPASTLPPVGATGSSLENERFRVGLPAGAGDRPGALTSLFDRASGREYADPRGKYGLNEWLLLFRSETIGNGVYLPLHGRLVEVPGYAEAHVATAEGGPVVARATIEGTLNPQAVVPSFASGAGTLIEGLVGETVTIPEAIDVRLTQEVRLYRGGERVEFVDTFPSLPTQILESAVAYPLPGDPAARALLDPPFGPIRIGGTDPFGAFALGPGQEGDQFMALKMNPGAANAYSIPFDWIQGIPADDVTRSWTNLTSGGRTLALSCRETGAVLPGHLTMSPVPDTTEDPALYSLRVGPTLVGQVLLGTPPGETQVFHCAIALGLTDPAALDRFGRGYTHPPIAAEVDGPSRGALPPLASLLETLGGSATVTWVKPAEDGQGVLLRVQGIESGTVGFRLPLAPPGTRLVRVDAAELSPSCAVAVTNGVHHLHVEGGALVNLRTGDPAGLPACPSSGSEGCGCRESDGAHWHGAFLALLGLLALRRRRRRAL